MAPVFPLDRWDGTRVRKAFQSASKERLGVAVDLRSWRHLCIAIFRKYCDPNTAEKMEMWDMGDEDYDDETYDVQAAHRTHTAETIYGRASDLAHFETANKKGLFHRMGGQWHRHLTFDSVTQGPNALLIQEVLRAHDAGLDERFRRWNLMRSVNIQDEMERLLGPTAQFRGIQEPALMAIMRGKSPIIAVMGTGEGKNQWPKSTYN